ncbi:S9 family peptidase [Yunchengibacter salinarum]|uniref:S9 family peptidase n=1 Tax=Yunchengibacter salinarum TaxID=3133399 RepID=UPI0035B57733
MTILPAPASISPPRAATRPHRESWHGRTIDDPYHWLRDPDYPNVQNPDILAYLEAENKYFESVMGQVKPLTETLYNEIRGRIKEDDESVPWRDGAYEYRWTFAAGAQYRTWQRRPLGESHWTTILDEVAEASAGDYFRLGQIAVSPDGRLLAFSADRDGSERFTIEVRDLISGERLADRVGETSGEIVWEADNSGFFFVTVSAQWRPYRLERHRLGAAENTLLFEEEDPGFFVHIHESSDRRFLLVKTGDHRTTEVRPLPLRPTGQTMAGDGEKTGTLQPPLAPRRDGHDYDVDHGDCGFVIRSNRAHINFSLYNLGDGATGGEADWCPIRHGDDRLYIRDMQVFRDFIAVEERRDGMDQLRILPLGPDGLKGDGHDVTLAEDVRTVSIGTNAVFDAGFVRLGYSSLVTPPSVLDYDVATRDLSVRKEQEIPSGYDKHRYRSERLMVTARDGTQVPVSLVMRRDWQKGAGQPLHLYGYGAYGMGMPPGFSAARLSLLDRGFAFAIAHIRGGDELGHGWYEAGKLDRRENTFNDFVDVARHLASSGYAETGGISISGGSAGGELMGAAVNQAPELFRAAVLHVPFVDVLNTMLDDSLPLTPIEWPEWGNPRKSPADFDTIRAYCPYSNIRPQDYPPMMITGGLNDPRVTYWEPAKWTARLRATKTDDNLLVMKINMGAGHGGKSGRFEAVQEVAEEFTFLLMAFGLAGREGGGESG